MSLTRLGSGLPDATANGPTGAKHERQVPRLSPLRPLIHCPTFFRDIVLHLASSALMHVFTRNHLR
jgi:hypothetical protein